IIRKTMPGRLRVSEWIALAYFLYLIALAAVARVSVSRRQRVLATAPVTSAAIVTIGLQAGAAAALARDWLPRLYGAMAYWLAALPCYGLLPWLPTRPPRAIETPERAVQSAMRALNVKILDRASVQLNTFPSGHAAASIAIALAVGSHVPLAGAVLGIVAVSI